MLSRQHKEDAEHYYFKVESKSIYPLMRFISKLRTKRCIKHNGGVAPVIQNTGISTVKIIGLPKNENTAKLWKVSKDSYNFDM